MPESYLDMSACGNRFANLSSFQTFLSGGETCVANEEKCSRVSNFFFFFPVKKTRLTLVKFQVGFGTQILKDMHLGFCQLSEE